MEQNSDLSRRDLGTQYENLALRWLKSRGYVLRVLAHQYRCRMGEVDWVIEMQNGDGTWDLVFLEVRSRVTEEWIPLVEAITPRKRRRLELTIQHYLQWETLSREYRGVRLAWVGWDGRRWNYLPSAWH